MPTLSICCYNIIIIIIPDFVLNYVTPFKTVQDKKMLLLPGVFQDLFKICWCSPPRSGFIGKRRRKWSALADNIKHPSSLYQAILVLFSDPRFICLIFINLVISNIRLQLRKDEHESSKRNRITCWTCDWYARNIGDSIRGLGDILDYDWDRKVQSSWKIV